MKNKSIQEVIVLAVLVVLLVVILNPFGIWMPDMVHAAVLASVLVVFALYATFFLREKAHDERDESHRMLSGRVAFLSGSAMLVTGIAYQGFTSGAIDGWIIASLVTMAAAKIGTRIYSDLKF